MMQLCTGVNGRRRTPIPTFFIFLSPFVLKVKQNESSRVNGQELF